MPRYDFESITDFSDAAYIDDGIYKTAWDTIYSFESSYFSHTSQIQTTPYISQSIITYNPFTGLSIQSKNNVRKIAFFRDYEKEKGEAQEFLQCDKTATTYFSLACREMRKRAILESLSYPVLTKGKAIQNIMEKVDGNLWGVSEKK